MLELLFCALGGSIGSVMRHMLSTHIHKLSASGFPWGSLNVNLIGSLVIGLLWGISENFEIAPNLRIFLMVGLLGSFTTFSTFSMENFQLMKDGHIGFVVINIITSNIGGIGLAFAGFFIAKSLFTTATQS